MENKKEYDCNMIQDLLPLYQDHICSESSKAIVEEHLKECTTCQGILQKLGNASIEDQLLEQKESVLGNHAKKEQRRTTTIGMITAGVFMIPVVVSLIVNLATGHALDWFFIVLTSLLVAASITIVPLMMHEHTLLWTIGSFIVSLGLLLLVICLYTKGNWFALAFIPALYGLIVFAGPVVLYQVSLPKYLSRQKGLIAMILDTAGLYALIGVIGCYNNYEDYWRIALGVTNFSILLPWIIFLVVRYLKVPTLIKAGIITILSGTFCTFVNDVIDYLIDGTGKITIAHYDCFRWDTSIQINANIYLPLFIMSILTGIGLIIAGCMKRHK